MRRKRLGLLIFFGGLCLAGVAVLAWALQPRPLSPAGAAVVGTWVSPQQPDGSSTAVVLYANRTCRVRWLDTSGQDDPQQPPQTGRWRVKDGTLVVDTRRPQTLRLVGADTRTPGHTWTFAVADAVLMHGPDSGKPVTLRRSPDAPR